VNRLYLFLMLVAMCFIPQFAAAQSINLDMGGDDGSAATKLIQIIALTTILTIAPSILIMVTSFVRVVVVLSLLRTAIGIQQSPPNPVLTSLAMFLTFFIMSPTLEASYANGLKPYMDGKMEQVEALEKTSAPFHKFMLSNVRDKDLQLFADIGKIKLEKAEDTPFRILIPAFMISELRRSFEIGFLVFVPFLIMDMLVASILMSMGMMMLPPVVISLPFKLAFFVMADGWYLICGSLVRSFNQ